MKKNLLKFFLFAFILTFAGSINGYSQSSNDDWTLVKDSARIQFYYKTVLCNDAETIVYKIKNSSHKTTALNWTVWGIGSKETISIDPGQEQAGSCVVNNKLVFTIPAGASIVNNTLAIKFTVFK